MVISSMARKSWQRFSLVRINFASIDCCCAATRAVSRSFSSRNNTDLALPGDVASYDARSLVLLQENYYCRTEGKEKEEEDFVTTLQANPYFFDIVGC